MSDRIFDCSWEETILIRALAQGAIDLAQFYHGPVPAQQHIRAAIPHICAHLPEKLKPKVFPEALSLLEDAALFDAAGPSPLEKAERILAEQSTAEGKQKKEIGCMAQRYMDRVMARDLTQLSIAQSLATIAARPAEAPQLGEPLVVKFSDGTSWEDRVWTWRELNGWSEKWGPRPYEAGCLCPAKYLVQA